MNIDFRYRSIEIEEKVVTSINIDDFQIEVDNVFFIDYYRFRSIVIDFVNRS